MPDLGEIPQVSGPTIRKQKEMGSKGWHTRHVRETCSDFSTVTDINDGVIMCDMWYIYIYIYMICCVNLFVFHDVFCSSLEVIRGYYVTMLLSAFLSAKSWSMLVRSLEHSSLVLAQHIPSLWMFWIEADSFGAGGIIGSWPQNSHIVKQHLTILNQTVINGLV